MSTLKYAPNVTTKAGLVRGFIQEVPYADGKSENTGEVYLYQGIPYGKAKRFEKALPLKSWEGSLSTKEVIYNATSVRANPPQLGLEIPYKGYYTQEYSEDCLLLNVWKPILSKEKPLPVMFYIFGGGFHTGSIFKLTHDARWIAQRGEVMVVMPNNRLGCLGWLFGGDEIAPANLALHDITLALKWVQDNVASFGGDPENITLFGNSSGSLLVSLLLLSPSARGLFHRAILQSGVADAEIRPKEEKVALTRKFAQEVGMKDVENREIEEVINFLKKAPLEEMLKATKRLDDPFRPVYGDELVPVRPIEALLGGQFNANVDIMYGVCRDEGGAFAVHKCPELDDKHAQLTVQETKDIFVKLIGEHWAEEAYNFYAKRASLKAEPSFSELRDLIMRAYGDYMMISKVLLFGETIANKSKEEFNRKCFAWVLTRPAAVHIASICNGRDWLGVGHADELYFLFTILRQNNENDRQLSVELCKAWSSFARSASPGPVCGTKWEEALEGNRNPKSCKNSTRFMALDYQCKMVGKEHFEPITAFWRDKLFI